jgi:hypothetical protein
MSNLKKFPQRKDREGRLIDLHKSLSFTKQRLEEEFGPYADNCAWRSDCIGYFGCRHGWHIYRENNPVCTAELCPRIR